MTLTERLARLAKVRGDSTPVVSVYLNTRWKDEHQREHTRTFLKTELKRARQGHPGEGLADALDWVQSQGEALLTGAPEPDTFGVALFACPAVGLREVIPVHVPFEEAFVVAATPFLRPLAAALGEAPPALVVFVDGESARLIPMLPDQASEEVRLDSAVPGRHRRGGWAQLAESRYRRHIEDRRDRHFEAVAETLSRLVEEYAVERVVLAGEPGTVAALRKALPAPMVRRVAGTVTAARHEPASLIVTRAATAIAEIGGRETRAAVDEALGDDAGGGKAAAGLEPVLDAIGRGAVHRLYVLREFHEPGRVCAGCDGIQPGGEPTCRRCGRPTMAAELGDAMVDRVLAAGGSVTLVAAHDGLGRAGGVVARLRFPL